MTDDSARTALDGLLTALDAASFVDLSPTIRDDMPVWAAHPRPSIVAERTHEQHGYYSQTLTIAEHTGAHVDAPAHSVPELSESTVERWPVGHLIAPGVRLDLTRLELGPGERATAHDLEAAAKHAGAGDLDDHVILLDFGWHRRSSTNGAPADFLAANSPGLADSAVEWLAAKKPRAIGADTLSVETALVDGTPTTSGRGHALWSRAGIAIIESLANLERVTDRFLFVALPLKIDRGSGSPLRPIAVCYPE